ncbi:ABC transporter permease subunit [Micromonospora purpureochromogenes]|uniref:ABC transporter permease n=1 Tax=Micromonospora purpureochromogenes TaxID=47872 RepID=UPI00340BAB28
MKASRRWWLLALLALILAGPWLAPHPVDQPITLPYATPNAQAWLGGDQLGRDVFSRLLAGGADLLLTSGLVALLVTAAAAVLGVIAALRPTVGRLIERTTDLVILLPTVLGILLITLNWPGGGRVALIVAATILGIPYAIRVTAAAAAPVAATGFVETAVASGERLWYLVLFEILPNLRGTMLTLFGLRFVAAVYVVTTAGFLEIGPQPPAAHWALMIRENSAGIQLNPWAVIAPSLAVGLLATGITLATGSRRARAAAIAQTGRQ